MHEGVLFRKITFDKMTAVRAVRHFDLIWLLYMHGIMPSWADQLLPQLLKEQFDTLSIQYRQIEHMHEGDWFRKNNF